MDTENEAVGAGDVPRVALPLPEAVAALGASRQSVRDENLTDLLVAGAERQMLGGVPELEEWVDDGSGLSALTTRGHDAR